MSLWKFLCIYSFGWKLKRNDFTEEFLGNQYIAYNGKSINCIENVLGTQVEGGKTFLLRYIPWWNRDCCQERICKNTFYDVSEINAFFAQMKEATAKYIKLSFRASKAAQLWFYKNSCLSNSLAQNWGELISLKNF